MDARAGPADVDDFPAIADYGVIGNLETVAYVANTGAIEFFAYPSFDSPTLFAAMLDRGAGRFAIETDVAARGTQRYETDTNVLVTRLEDGGRAVEITDFMPLGDARRTNQLVRIVRCVRGAARVRARCEPRPDYARAEPAARLAGARTALLAGSDGRTMRLVCNRDLVASEGGAAADVHLQEGERLVLSLVCDGAPEDLLAEDAVEEALAATIARWRGWLAQSTYRGRWRDAVMRSALALKLMFSDTHGSIVAAPTFGLPEAVGAGRNFDYRYCWIRDSAFTIYAMLRLGFVDEAESYRCWLRDRLTECGDGALRLMYRLDGSTKGLEERELDHLSGYRNSRPVRIGNAAFEQVQLDIYGEMIDSLYIAHKEVGAVTETGWRAIAGTVDYVCAHWRDKGSGIWEMRGPPAHYLDAFLMCWVTIDRALRLSHKTGFPSRQAWAGTREAIREAILGEFFNEAIGAFTQTAGSRNLDAVALLMPLVKFLPTTDGRFRATMDAIERRLVDGPFVRRYEMPECGTDGFDGPQEGYFVTCSFWWIECLARSSRVAEAQNHFERLLSYASPLGLLSEEMSRDGEHLGNTPQALSHLSMISAAVALNRAIDNGGEPF